MSEPMYAHKIPNFEIGLQVGCKFSMGGWHRSGCQKENRVIFYAAVEYEFRDSAFVNRRMKSLDTRFMSRPRIVFCQVFLNPYRRGRAVLIRVSTV